MSSTLPGSESSPDSAQSGHYIGRFAPSPTGPLHFGSLITAVASYLQAKAARGSWLLRIEDLDTPRVVPGAADDILRTLASHGFEWDGPVVFQSERLDLYTAAMRQLCDQQSVYACSCSRAQIAALHASSAVVEADDLAYPGTCRSSNLPIDGQLALRLAVPPGVVSFVDRVQGRQAQEVAVAVGDFVVRRRDGIFAYHLATVVDDSAQAITEIVRGFDLVLSTPRQIVLQRALGLSTPAYGHVPMAVDRLGNKLSKSSQSIAITVTDPSSTLWLALQALCQSPPLALRNAPPAELWRWAGDNWSLTALQGHTHCLAPAPEPT